MSSTPLQWILETCTCAHGPKCIQNFSGFQVSGSHFHVVNLVVVLCHVVAFIMMARHPIVSKLMLPDVIAQPVETDVHGFCPSWGNGIIDDAQICRVVRLNGLWGMGVAHID